MHAGRQDTRGQQQRLSARRCSHGSVAQVVAVHGLLVAGHDAGTARDTVLTMVAPGVTSSGLMRPSGVGPYELKSGTLFWSICMHTCAHSKPYGGEARLQHGGSDTHTCVPARNHEAHAHTAVRTCSVHCMHGTEWHGMMAGLHTDACCALTGKRSAPTVTVEYASSAASSTRVTGCKWQQQR